MNAQKQQGLAVSETPLHLLMENVKDYAIFLLDREGRVVTWNAGAEHILGWTEHEILGQSFSCIFTPVDIKEARSEYELNRARERGRAEDERWHVRKDGSRFWASGVVTPLLDEAGNLQGYAKILRDMTDRKRTEEELADMNRRKDEFLAMLSHELRNPLASIQNALQLICRKETELLPDIGEAAEIIKRQVFNLTHLIEDLLDVSRIAKGKIQLRQERVELREIVTIAVETAHPLIKSRKHQLSVSLPPESIWVDVDPIRMEQVLANLLQNAAKYTEPAGYIFLSVEREGTQVVIRVKDTGIGIPPAMLPRVFDLYVQADRSPQRLQGGLGVGLTLAKRLVDMHGGTIEAYSEGVGNGSEFIVRLPVVAEVVGIEPETEPVTASYEADASRILVVEDNVDTAHSLAMLLKFDGHEVQVVHNGPDALRTAEAEAPDVILLDIGLPGMDGLQVAHHLRQRGALRKARLIAMTGYGQEEDCQRSTEAGFDYHLTKPVSFAELQELLRTEV